MTVNESVKSWRAAISSNQLVGETYFAGSCPVPIGWHLWNNVWAHIIGKWKLKLEELKRQGKFTYQKARLYYRMELNQQGNSKVKVGRSNIYIYIYILSRSISSPHLLVHFDGPPYLIACPTRRRSCEKFNCRTAFIQHLKNSFLAISVFPYLSSWKHYIESLISSWIPPFHFDLKNRTYINYVW